MNLKYDEDPKYSWMIALFEPLCGSALHRPIKISESTLAKVGQKRTRDMLDDKDEERALGSGGGVPWVRGGALGSGYPELIATLE